MHVKTDSTVSGETWRQAWTVRRWGRNRSVFAATATKNISWTMWSRGKFIAVQLVPNASAKCSITSPSDFKCRGCKHSAQEHGPNGARKCVRAGCKCGSFNSTHSCSCGTGYDKHATVFESREEREAAGRPVDPKWMQDQNMVAGLGGIGPDFSSLADGQDKLDMMDPQVIMNRLEDQGHMKAIGQGVSKGGQKKMIGGPRGSQQQQQQQMQVAGSGLGGQMVPVQQEEPSMDALALFMTPHKYGGAHGGLTKKMAQLKM